MKRIGNVFAGLGLIVIGFIIYPYYVEDVITPISDLITSMFPSLNVLESTMLTALPLIVLLLILFFGIVHIIGKASPEGKE